MVEINTGFKIGSPTPVDERFVLTKEQMLNINDSIMPEVYITICSDDKSLYIYNKSAEPNGETGKFSVFNSSEVTEETEPIDFSTWDGYVAHVPETTGTTIEGETLIVGDDSNVTIDPDDIEDDD